MGRAHNGIREVVITDKMNGELVISLCHFERRGWSGFVIGAEADHLFERSTEC